MRKLHEVLRLKWEHDLSNRAIARSCGISPATVSEYVQRARAAGLSWPLPADLSEDQLWARLCPPTELPRGRIIPVPDWAQIHTELRRKGVTLRLLWDEYRANAISLILAEFDRIRKEPVSDAEMETAINYYLESFADSFQSAQATMMSFANLEMTGKPADYFKTYRSKIQAVTKARVQEVAQKYVRPDKAAIMIVGDFEPCNKGGDKWAGPLDKLGKVHRISLRSIP